MNLRQHTNSFSLINRYAQIFTFAVSLNLVSACGGGGSATEGGTAPVTIALEPVTKLTNASAINPALKGQLVFYAKDADEDSDYSNRIQLTELDLATGIESSAVGSRLDEDAINNVGQLKADARPVLSSQFGSLSWAGYFWQVDRNAQIVEGTKLNYVSNIPLQGSERKITSMLTRSPNGKFKAVLVERRVQYVFGPQFTTTRFLEIIDESDKVVFSNVDSIDGILPLAYFVNDETVIYASGDIVYLHRFTSDAAPTQLKFNDRINAFDVSADRKTIVLTVYGGQAWVMDSNGNNLRQLLERSKTCASTELLGTFAISPKGNKALFPFRQCDKNSSSLALIDLEQPTLSSIQSLPESSLVKFTDQKTGAATTDLPPDIQRAFGESFGYYRAINWLDLPPREGFKEGSRAQGLGLNRGIGGNLFTDQAIKIDLSSGQSTTPLKPTNWRREITGISTDGLNIHTTGELATAEIPNIAYAESYARTVQSTWDLNGKLVRQIVFPDTACFPARFSPNQSYCACLGFFYPLTESKKFIATTSGASTLKDLPNLASFEWLNNDEWVGVGVGDTNKQNELFAGNIAQDKNRKIFSDSYRFELLGASSDGKKVLIKKDKQIWMVQENPPQTTQLTDSSIAIAHAFFAQNDQFVVVVSGTSIKETTVTFGISSAQTTRKVWAIPADGVRVPVFNSEIKSTSGFELKSLVNGQEQPISSMPRWWRK
jgi:hypothetical protein